MYTDRARTLSQLHPSSVLQTERLHRQELALNRIRADLSQLSDRLWNTYELSYAKGTVAADGSIWVTDDRSRAILRIARP